MIGQDTASTPRWWIARTTRPTPSASVTMPAATSTPVDGSRCASASACAARRSASWSGLPAGAIEDRVNTWGAALGPSVREPSVVSSDPATSCQRSPSRVRRADSIGCTATSSDSNSDNTSTVIPAGAWSTRYCEKSAKSEGAVECSIIHDITGSSGRSPCAPPAGSSSAGRRCASPATTRAIARMVRCSKMSRGVSVNPAARTAEASWIDMIESPPSAKNDWMTETRSSPSRPDTMLASVSSVAFAGAT